MNEQAKVEAGAASDKTLDVLQDFLSAFEEDGVQVAEFIILGRSNPTVTGSRFYVLRSSIQNDIELKLGLLSYFYHSMLKNVVEE